MKKILSLLVLFTAFTFVSCEDEPLDPSLLNTDNSSGGNNGGGSTSVIGSYKLTALNSSIPTDLNNDGTSSINQLNEHNCYNDMFLTINSNNTFNADAKGIEINAAGTSTDCFTDPDYNGTWAQNGNNITLTYVDGGTTYNDVFTISGNTLNLSVTGGEIIGLSSGQPIYLTANVQFIYTKQ
jgi:hypothetical protein